MRAGVFTLNNPTDEAKAYFKNIEEIFVRTGDVPPFSLDDPVPPGCMNLPWRYGVGQLEIAPGTGTPHIQGYFEFTKQLGFSTIKSKLPGEPHIEERRGSASDCIRYCKKDDSRHPDLWQFEFGKSVGQGFRSDLDGTANKVAEEVMEGNSLDEIKMDHPGYFMEKKEKIMAFRAMHRAVRVRRDKKFIIMYGPTGSGKTATVDLKFPDHHDLMMPTKDGPMWWDGYSGEDTVVLDEFGKGKIPYNTIKRLVDYKVHTYPVKHSSCLANPKNVIVTTTVHPKDWYPGVQDKKEFQRRIREFGELWEFSGSGVYPDFAYTVTPMTGFEFESFVSPDNLTEYDAYQ